MFCSVSRQGQRDALEIHSVSTAVILIGGPFVEQEHQNGHTHLNGFDVIPRGAIPGGAIARVAALGSAPLGEVTIVNGSSANGTNANGSTSNESTKNGHETNGAAARRSPAQASVALQQVGEARRRQGLSVRCVAQRLNMTIGDVRAQEEPDADMSLSELYRWQSVLEVPLEELLADPQETLSSRVLTRARMLRVMKTAQALVSQARTESESRLAKLLVSQLVEIMPELKEVAAWPTVGHRRTADEMGRIAERTIPDDFMYEAG
jgi:ribosome-binding protein aMBF1 (putative translation factor)